MPELEPDQPQSDPIHDEALRRFNVIRTAEREHRKLAVEDIRFAQTPDGQWDDLAKTKRANRPRYTLNKIASAIDTIIGDQRQSPISAHAVGLTDDADQAELIDGHVRSIEIQSSAKNVYDQAFDEMLNGGYGGWRIATRHSTDDVSPAAFHQDIFLEPINSATTSLWFDTDAKQYDKRDATHGYVTWFISKDAREEKYPNATINDFDHTRYATGACESWFRGESVQLAEYWRKVPVTLKLALLSDGRVIDEEEDGDAIPALEALGGTVVQRRTVTSHKVEQYIMDGAQILEGPNEWAGKFIPLIPLYGKINHIEDETHIRGLVRFAKDAQRVYNYLRSALVETTALTPKDPYWITPKQAKGHTTKLGKLATENPPFQLYNPDPVVPGPPQRSGAPQLQQAMVEQAQSAALDITATLGVTAGTAQPMAGTDLDMRSGKAIEAQARRGDAGAFVFSDNLLKSVQYSAVVLVDLIPRIIDSDRMLRVVDPDGSENLKPVNQKVPDPDNPGQFIIVNDLTTGKYDVTAKAGPMFATQREKEKVVLQELATENQAFAELTPDLIAKSLDTPMADELHKRLRKNMLARGIVEPTEEEAQEMNVEAAKREQIVAELVPQITQQLQTDAQVRLLNAEAGKREGEVQVLRLTAQAKAQDLDADANKSELDANKTANEAYATMLDNIEKQLQLGIPLGQAAHDLRIGQQDLIAASQQAIVPGPNSEQQQQTQQAIQQFLLTPQL